MQEIRQDVVMKLRVWSGCFAVIAAVICGGLAKAAQAEWGQWANEYELKAAFVYNLLAFVQLPEGSVGDHVVVGIASESPMAAVVSKFLGSKRVGSRSIEVRDVHSRNELRACNVILFSDMDRNRQREALAQVQDAGILTVGDGEDFARMGGVIAFVPRDNTFRLVINPQAAERAHIQLSSKLLRMASLVSAREN